MQVGGEKKGKERETNKANGGKDAVQTKRSLEQRKVSCIEKAYSVHVGKEGVSKLEKEKLTAAHHESRSDLGNEDP
jgi:hypothetical protein